MDLRRADGRITGQPRVTQNVSLSVHEQRLLRWLADRTAGGNVSFVVRRLIRCEAARYDDAPRPEMPTAEPVEQAS